MPLPLPPPRRLLAGDRAVRRDTQAVRKARSKFGIPIVGPAYIRDSIAAGARRDHASYLQLSKGAARAAPASTAATTGPAAAPPAACSIAARAVASGCAVLGLDDGHSSPGSADGSLDVGTGPASQGASTQNGRLGGRAQAGREPTGVSEAKVFGRRGCLGGVGTAGEASSEESAGDKEEPPAVRPHPPATGGRACAGAAVHVHSGSRGGSTPAMAEERWRVSLGLPALRPRPSLVRRAMASVGSRSGLRHFKTLARRLGRLRRRHWFALPTSVERAFLVGSMRAFAQAAGALDEEAAEAVAEHRRRRGGWQGCADWTCGHANFQLTARWADQ